MFAINDLLPIDSYELNELLDNKKVHSSNYFFNLKKMNFTDLEKLGEAMEDPFAKELDKNIIVSIMSIRLILLANEYFSSLINRYWNTKFCPAYKTGTKS